MPETLLFAVLRILSFCSSSQFISPLSPVSPLSLLFLARSLSLSLMLHPAASKSLCLPACSGIRGKSLAILQILTIPCKRIRNTGPPFKVSSLGTHRWDVSGLTNVEVLQVAVGGRSAQQALHCSEGHSAICHVLPESLAQVSLSIRSLGHGAQISTAWRTLFFLCRCVVFWGWRHPNSWFSFWFSFTTTKQRVLSPKAHPCPIWDK